MDVQIKDIYIKILFTRFNPLYIALGNQGQITYVYKEYQQHYDRIAVYRLNLDNNASIEGDIYKVTGGFKTYVRFIKNGHEELITSTTFTEKQALANLETALKETISKKQEAIKQKYPDFFAKEGQLSLF